MDMGAISANNNTFLFGAKFSADASYVVAGEGRYAMTVTLHHRMGFELTRANFCLSFIFEKNSDEKKFMDQGLRSLDSRSA